MMLITRTIITITTQRKSFGGGGGRRRHSSSSRIRRGRSTIVVVVVIVVVLFFFLDHNLNGTRRGKRLTQHDLDQCGFPGSIGSDQCHDFSFRYRQMYVL